MQIYIKQNIINYTSDPDEANDLTFSNVGGHTRIKDDEGDLLAIVQNTLAADITFV